MARLLYGGSPADFAVALGTSTTIPGSSPTADGRAALIPEDSVTLEVYTDPDEDPTTDLLNETGDPITEVATSTDDGALGTIPRFQGPEGWSGDLYLSSDATHFFRLAPSTDSLFDRVTVIEGNVAGLSLDDLVDVSLAGGTTGQVLTRQTDGSYAPAAAGSGSVSSVNGKTPTAGAVTLVPGDIGAGTASGQTALAAVAVAVLLQSGSGYPTRPSVAHQVIYVGTATPVTGVADGDIWHQPVTT